MKLSLRKLLVCLLVVGGLAACRSTPGRDAPPPPQHTSRLESDSQLTLYRADATRAYGRLKLKLDGAELGVLDDGACRVMGLASGAHRLDVSLKAMGLLPTSWNSLDFRAAPGEQVRIRLWAAYQEVGPTNPTREQEAAGMPERQASVGIFAGIASPDDPPPPGPCRPLRRDADED